MVAEPASMLARVLEISVVVVVLLWVSRLGKSHPHWHTSTCLPLPCPAASSFTKLLSGTCAGGLSWRPTKLPGGGNDTGKLFNVHPVVMITAFGVVMAEALQSWRQPLVPSLDRYGRLRTMMCIIRRRGKPQREKRVLSAGRRGKCCTLPCRHWRSC